MQWIMGRTTGLSFAGWDHLRWSAAVLALGLSLLVFLRFGWSPAAVQTTLFAWLLLLFAVIDLEQRLVPDRLLLATLPIVLVLDLWVQDPTLLSSLGGGAVALTIFSLIHLARPAGMGRGDVKLAGLIGLMVGFPNVVFALLLGMIAGGLAALFLLLRGEDRKQSLPYVPALALGAWLALIFA